MLLELSYCQPWRNIHSRSKTIVKVLCLRHLILVRCTKRSNRKFSEYTAAGNQDGRMINQASKPESESNISCRKEVSAFLYRHEAANPLHAADLALRTLTHKLSKSQHSASAAWFGYSRAPTPEWMRSNPQVIRG